MNISECLSKASELEQTSDSARLDIEVLLAWVIGKNRTYLYTWPEYQLTEEQQLKFDAGLAQRKNGEPIAYICGEKEFWSLPLFCDSSTLIPRPDTELLVELALDKLSTLPHTATVLDLGTGTGAIALAIASENRNYRVVGVDKSSDAITLAQKNKQRLKLHNAEFFQSDWFEFVGIGLNPGRSGYDLIMSNPPYIDAQDTHLNEGDVRFEPETALVADENGLADIKKIVSGAKDYLIDGGWLLIEHGWNQGSAVRDVFTQNNFVCVETVQDLGGNDRVTLGQFMLE